MTTLVTATEWGVSFTTGTAITGAVLNVHKLEETPNKFGGIGNIVKHPEFDGMTFGSHDEARAFAHGAGLLKPFVRMYSDSVEDLFAALGI